jgi:hypothetical protein
VGFVERTTGTKARKRHSANGVGTKRPKGDANR